MDKKKDEPVFVPAAGPPQQGPSKLIYSAMGEENIFRMCADFYGELEKSPIRPLFGDDMNEASKKIAAFFVGLLGGPPLYQRLYGNPMMRARHMPFVIDARARNAWLGCFKKTLEDAPKKYNFPEEHLPGFITFLEEFSAWMVNRG